MPDYAPIPASAFGPAPNEQGYYVGRVERNLYWVTDGAYQAAFLTTPDGRRQGFTFAPIQETTFFGTFYHPNFEPDSDNVHASPRMIVVPAAFSSRTISSS